MKLVVDKSRLPWASLRRRVVQRAMYSGSRRGSAEFCVSGHVPCSTTDSYVNALCARPIVRKKLGIRPIDPRFYCRPWESISS